MNNIAQYDIRQGPGIGPISIARKHLHFHNLIREFRATDPFSFANMPVPTFSENIPVTANVIRRLVMARTAIYKTPPLRSVSPYDREKDEQLNDLYFEWNINKKMEELNKMMNLCNSALLWYRPKYLRVIGPDRYYPEMKDGQFTFVGIDEYVNVNERKILAWYKPDPDSDEPIRYYERTIVPTNQNPRDRYSSYFWPAFQGFERNIAASIVDGLQPMGEFQEWPFVHVVEDEFDDEDLLIPWYNNELLKLQRLANIALTKTNSSAMSQTTSPLIVTGADSFEGRQLSANRPITIPRDVELGYLAPVAVYADAFDNYLRTAKVIATLKGVSSSVLDLEPTPVQSGESKRQDMLPIQDVIDSQVKIFGRAEQQLYNLIKTDDSELSVDFDNTKANPDPSSQNYYTQAQTRQQLGILSTPQLVMETQPGIKSLEEAQTYLRDQAEAQAVYDAMLRETSGEGDEDDPENGDRPNPFARRQPDNEDN